MRKPSPPKKLRLLNSNFKLLTGLILLCRVVTRASSAVWQWSVEAKREHPENGVARAFLWIPPDGKRVRGVVVAQHNREATAILKHPMFRAARCHLFSQW